VGIVIVPEHSHATVAIMREGKFLTMFFKKKTEFPWRFSGGKIDLGEIPIQAAARELKEELGIDALDLRFVTREQHDVDGNTWTGFWFVCHNYEGTISIQEPDKHGDPQWLTLSELAERGAHPEYSVAHEILRRCL
jgi:mutator protein MutT